MKFFLVLLGHVVIVVFCVLAAIVLNVLLVSTTSINGKATVSIGSLIEFPLPSVAFGSLLMPATAGLLLLVVYAPGWIWPTVKRLPVRLGLTAVLVATTLALVRS